MNLTLLKAKDFIKHEGLENQRVVLYSRPLPPLNGQDRREYVTWLETDKGERVLGHYFRDLNTAVADFEKREV